MFERFTERARRAVMLAEEEARTLRHGHIGTEHLLLGLLREHDGVGGQVLASFDITLERARGEVVRIVGAGETDTPGQLPFTPRAKQVLELAVKEMGKLGHNYIGTEHLLLGLAALGDSVSARILIDCDAKPDAIRQAVIRVLSGQQAGVQLGEARAQRRGEARAHRGEATPTGPPASSNGFQEWIRVGPGAGLRRLLMLAAARALDDGREDIQPRDVLLALTRDEHTGPVLADLGVDDVAIRRALERRRPPEAPRSPPGG